MKNLNQRVEDAKNESARKKRPRIGDRKPAMTEVEKERVSASKLLKPDMSVWEIVNHYKVQAARREAERDGDILNSSFKTNRERITHNNHAYARMTIAEAFAANYSVEVSDPQLGNDLPTAIKVGDVINLQITSISKQTGVVFSSGSYKENFATRNNLGRYSAFGGHNEVRAKVVEITPKVTYVDIWEPLLDEFINPRVAEPWTQYALEPSQIVPVRVKDLHLVRGGYLGKAVIPNISEMLGEDFTVDAFVPGSQIVLNTTEDFESFEGQEVTTFITSYGPKPNGKGMSLVCSRKNFLKHQGHLNMIELHKMWCDDGKEWKEFAERDFPGRITGVINSSKKCGAFVEVPHLNITGMIMLRPEELVEYPMNNWINVKFKTFEEELVYNEAVGQFQHTVPFEVENGAIKKVNVRPIFDVVK